MPIILVVDDELSARLFLRNVLKGAGHEVHQAANGAEAMAQIRSVTFDLVILNLIMPEQEGLETIQQLRREYPLLKVIAICGSFLRSSPHLMLEIAELMGATATLLKPFSADEALQTVQSVLES
jgi:CheY-like chemotaxis protein